MRLHTQSLLKVFDSIQKTMCKDKNDKIIFGIGGIIVMAALLPYLLLGGNMVVPFQDQLDGEVLCYMLHAKYLFTGTTVYPEMMNGISANGLFPPAPLLVLLYKIMSPQAAFVTNQIFCMLTAYAGMVLCMHQAVKNRLIAVFCGIVFAYLPMFSVYGLCQYGQPVLFYAFYLLYKGRHKRTALGIVILYGLMSSVVLVGYAILGVGALFLIWLAWKLRLRAHKWVFIGWLSLLGCYLVTNYQLLLQIFGIGSQQTSHKENIVRYGQNFAESFYTVFVRGTLHTPTHQQFIAAATILILNCGVSAYGRMKRRMRLAVRLLGAGLCFNLFCALFFAFYQSGMMAEFRNSAGGILKEFQADRIYWLTVSVWYFLLGLDLYLLWEWLRSGIKNKRKICAAAGGVGLSVLLCISAAIVYYYSDFNKNIHRLRSGESYEQITWNDFYAPDLFAQIDAFIGRDKSSYRTLSFGIYPAAPLYNGFYCLDGYSNNYDLSYMNAFREIIHGELDKDEALRKYFDEWGCRCYVLCAQMGINHYLLPKDTDDSIWAGEKLAFDTEAAKRLGAWYLFSAVRIPNAEELGMTLLREEPFETPDSYYAVWLYAL